MKAYGWLLVVGAACGVTYTAWKSSALDSFLDDSSGAIPACEEALQKILKSPSSYKRIKADYLAEPILDKDSYRKYELTKGCAASDFGDAICIQANAYQEEAFNKLLAADKSGSAEGRRVSVWEERYNKYKETYGPDGSAIVVIEYDADNSYGSALRDKYICSFGRKSGDRFSTSEIYLPDADLSAYGKI